jgi:hypothetical protein
LRAARELLRNYLGEEVASLQLSEVLVPRDLQHSCSSVTSVAGAATAAASVPAAADAHIEDVNDR